MTYPGALPDDYLAQIMPVLQSPPWLRESGRIGAVADLQPGLTDAEVEAIERRHGFRFPPDLRSLLQFALPFFATSWRDDPESIDVSLDMPADGMCWDIEHSGFWMKRWGPKPESLEQRFTIAREQVARAPRLIPVFGLRYLPATPCEAGNPVLSIKQTDIIIYGNDLADYFHRELGCPRPPWARDEPKPIEFWSLIYESHYDELEYSGRWPP